MTSNNIAINDITIPKGRRKPTKDRIKSIAQAIKAVGLLHPIVINENQRLIAGQTRLLAVKRLGWTEVPVRILKLDAIHAELAEIVENIERSNLSTLEEAEALKRMKEIYLALHPETKHVSERGGPGRGKTSKKQGSKTNDKMSSVLSFTEDTAQKTGKSQRSIQRDIALAEKLTDAIKTQITGTRVENSRAELKRLADLPPKLQKKVARVIGSGKAKTVVEAKKIAGVKDTVAKDSANKNSIDKEPTPHRNRLVSLPNSPAGVGDTLIDEFDLDFVVEMFESLTRKVNIDPEPMRKSRTTELARFNLSFDPVMGVEGLLIGLDTGKEGNFEWACEYAMKLVELIPKYIQSRKEGKEWPTADVLAN